MKKGLNNDSALEREIEIEADEKNLAQETSDLSIGQKIVQKNDSNNASREEALVPVLRRKVTIKKSKKVVNLKNALSRIIGYRLDDQRIKGATEKFKSGEFCSFDDKIEADIENELREFNLNLESTVDIESAEIRHKLRAIFGLNDEIATKQELLKPMQYEFVVNFMNSDGNFGLAFSTGLGKTRTFLRVVGEWLKKNPDDYILIVTPGKVLLPQIDRDIRQFDSTKHLASEIEILDKPRSKKKTRHIEEMDKENLERLAIEFEDNPGGFYDEIKKLNPNFKRLIAATPQKMRQIISENNFPFERVGLLIVDEGRQGSKQKTGQYASYGLYDTLKKRNKRLRMILADATPSEQNYLSEKFDISYWDFGEDPLFSRLHLSIPLQIEPNPIQKEFLERYSRILQDSCTKFLRELEHIKNFTPEISSIDLPCFTDKYPVISHKSYCDLRDMLIKIKKTVFRHERESVNDVMDALVAFNATIQLYRSLQNDNYEAFIEKILKYFEIIVPKKSIKKKSKKKSSVLTPKQVKLIFNPLKNDLIEEGLIFKFAAELKKTVLVYFLEHPKVDKLQEIIKKEIAMGKRVLVLCNDSFVADSLCHKANAKWGTSSCFIHGGATEGVKNSLRQKYMINKFKKGGYKVMFGTSVVQMGFDLPEIDCVICYSPAKNADEEIQSMGRMRKGGSMYTLCSEAEIGKSVNNSKKKKEYLCARIALSQKKHKSDYTDDSQTIFYNEGRTLKNEERQDRIMRHKFEGEAKERHFVDKLKEKSITPDGQIVDERFAIESISPPKHFTIPINQRLVISGHSLKIVVYDKTGFIDVYYKFADHNLGKARAIYELLKAKPNLPVIVTGTIKTSKKSGRRYISVDDTYMTDKKSKSATKTEKDGFSYGRQAVIPFDADDKDLLELSKPDPFKSLVTKISPILNNEYLAKHPERQENIDKEPITSTEIEQFLASEEPAPVIKRVKGKKRTKQVPHEQLRFGQFF